MRTFYIASSMTNREQTRLLADYLSSHYRMSWALHHDWTIEDEADVVTKVERAQLAIVDVMCAMSADLFILLRTPATSHGAHAEFGARLAMNKPVYLVQQDAPDHLFYDHPLVMRFKLLDDFLAYLPNLATPVTSGRLRIQPPS